MRFASWEMEVPCRPRMKCFCPAGGLVPAPYASALNGVYNMGQSHQRPAQPDAFIVIDCHIPRALTNQRE